VNWALRIISPLMKNKECEGKEKKWKDKSKKRGKDNFWNLKTKQNDSFIYLDYIYLYYSLGQYKKNQIRMTSFIKIQ